MTSQQVHTLSICRIVTHFLMSSVTYGRLWVRCLNLVLMKQLHTLGPQHTCIAVGLECAEMASQCHWLDHTIELSFGMPPELLSLQGFLGTFYCESSNSGLTTGAGEASGRVSRCLPMHPSAIGTHLAHLYCTTKTLQRLSRSQVWIFPRLVSRFAESLIFEGCYFPKLQSKCRL